MNRNSRLLLGGLQAGIIGALTLLAWLAIASVWYRRSVWWVPNLAATAFYGDAAMQGGFTHYTWAGLAANLAFYGGLGAVFALLARERGRGVTFLAAIAFGVGCYYVLSLFVWKAVSPTFALYSPSRAMLFGHLLYGGMLGRYPRYARELE